MADTVVREVLIPRYTAFYGSGTSYSFYTAPMSVRRYCTAILTGYRSVGLGLTVDKATLAFQLQQSTDLGKWFDVGSSFTPASADAEITVSRDLTLEWARVKVTVTTTGTSPGLTSWLIGHFVLREVAVGV